MTASSPRLRRRPLGVGAAALLVVLTASAGEAHDFWIEPSSFEPVPVSTVRLYLRVGESFDGRPVRRSAAHIERFVVAGPGAVRQVAGRDGLDPAGLVSITETGAHLVGYVSTPSAITLDASRFESYLEHEGLERVIAARRERGESAAPGRELFVRSAKTLLRSGGDPTGFDRLLDLPLELIPATDPTLTDEKLTLRLLFHGEPAQGVLVRLRARREPARALEARTDAEGHASFDLEGSDGADGDGGPWLATGIHMVREEQDPRADWTSYWASLTLHIGSSANATGQSTGAR